MLNYSIPILLSLLLISGCKSSKPDEEIIVPPAESYKKGLNYLERKKYRLASKHFSKIYFQHPGSDFTPYAELMEAYSLYKAKKTLYAIDVLTAFTELHPANEYIDYAYYLKILCYIDETTDIYHDQESAHKAKLLAEAFIEQFPNSKYLKEVKNKLVLLNDYLAGHQISIGNYYISQNNPIPALIRYQNAKSDYGDTAYIPESLYRLAIASKMLGMDIEEKYYINELKDKYPNTIWAKYLKITTSK